MRWGTEAGLAELLGKGVSSINSEKRTALQYYRSVDHAIELCLSYFGPTIRAAGGGKQEGLAHELSAVFNRYNRATDGTAVIENTYLLTVAARWEA